METETSIRLLIILVYFGGDRLIYFKVKYFSTENTEKVISAFFPTKNNKIV